MSMMKRQLEKLAERVNGDIAITDKLMDIVAIHNVRQDTDACWCWTNEHGTDICGGIGALANFIGNDCKTIRGALARNHIRLAVNGIPIWTTANGG